MCPLLHLRCDNQITFALDQLSLILFVCVPDLFSWSSIYTSRYSTFSRAGLSGSKGGPPGDIIAGYCTRHGLLPRVLIGEYVARSQTIGRGALPKGPYQPLKVTVMGHMVFQVPDEGSRIKKSVKEN